MHILHLYKDYYPVLGGIENHLRWLAEAQAARGHEVTVLVTNPHGRGAFIRMENGVEVIRASRLTTVASTPLSLDFVRRLRRLHPDIVHLHFPYPLGEVGQWLFSRGKATVMTYHSDVIRQKGILRFYNPLLRRILRRMDRIMPTSEPYIHSSPYLSSLADRCTVIPLGVNTKRFAKPHPQQVAAIRRRHPGLILLFVGRLRYYKGLNYLIEAMPHIPATLLIVGAGPEAAQLGEQAYLTGVTDRVRFLGDIGDEFLPGYYQAADIFVLPSSERSEAFGIVLIEAMAAGKPVISTELGTGTSWVNRHGETGLVTSARDAPALAKAILELLDNPGARQQMGVRAQVRAFADFDLDMLVDRTLSVYEDVLAHR
ncbi:MAG: glycosyltransferase [Caldilineales bacterium]|nr:glycosyltransferase [Caldilineales bacterium]